MRKERTLFIIGLWVMAMPFSGFPSSWKTVIFVLTGLTLVYLSYLFYSEAKKRMPKEENLASRAFVDNIGSGE